MKCLAFMMNALLLFGCASTSTASDRRSVRSLSNADVLPEVEQGTVDAEPPREIEAILRKPLDANAAVRVALLNNREIRARLRELGVARGNLVQAGVLPNPSVEAELLPERNTVIELRVEYSISGLLLSQVRKSAARAELDAARYAAAADTLALGYRARSEFYAVQAAEQRVRIANQSLEAFAVSREAARALRAAGNTTALELAIQEAQYERARIGVARLDLEATKAREALQRTLGTHGLATEWSTSGDVAELPNGSPEYGQIETQAIRSSLELASAKQHLEGIARRAGVARTEGIVPDIAADVHLLAGDPTTSQSFEKNWRVGAGVRVGLPVFDRKQGRALALESEFDAELERYYGKAVEIRSAARELRSELGSAYARARHFRTVVMPTQRSVVEQSLLQYNAMQLGIYALLAARREELDVELECVDTLREYWTAKAAVDALLAGTVVTRTATGTRSTTAGHSTGERE